VHPQVYPADARCCRYAYVIPGGFLETAAPGAHHSASFVMATYVFLAEK
jgi:hypothetical protein